MVQKSSTAAGTNHRAVARAMQVAVKVLGGQLQFTDDLAGGKVVKVRKDGLLDQMKVRVGDILYEVRAGARETILGSPGCARELEVSAGDCLALLFVNERDGAIHRCISIVDSINSTPRIAKASYLDSTVSRIKRSDLSKLRDVHPRFEIGQR